ncbi:MAG TPA: hypothetical protein VFS67_22825 [Polyangiaceae bacterium]|nr:hypothetical protein [Polyangiaceae bacterium]
MAIFREPENSSEVVVNSLSMVARVPTQEGLAHSSRARRQSNYDGVVIAA